MNIIATITSVLSQFRPFFQCVALVLGLCAAWLVATEFVPVLGQIWRPKVDAQRAAIIGAALALIGGKA